MPLLSTSSTRSPAGKLRSWGLPLIVLVVSLGATLISWLTARQNQERHDQARLSRFVGRTTVALQNRLGRYEDIARGAQGFLADGANPPTLDTWRSYVNRLSLPGRHPGLASLAFIRRVERGDLDRFLRSHPQLAGRYHLPASDPEPMQGPGEAHLIIELCEPGDWAAKVLGMDVGAIRAQRRAADRSRDAGEPALSRLVHFNRPQGREDALVLYVPVYQGLPTDPPTRRQALMGWVSAGILVKPLVEDILQGEEQGLAFELVDAGGTPEPQSLYRAPDWPRGALPQVMRTLEINGRTWQLRYAVKPGFYLGEGRYQPLALLLGGLTISFCLAAVVWSLAGTRRRALDLAHTINTSLHQALQRNRSHLAHTPLAVIETDQTFLVSEWNHSAGRIFGYSRQEALGRDLALLFPPEALPGLPARRAALLGSAGGTRTSQENLTRSGQRVLCDWYETPLRDEEGRFLGAIFLADDITERHQTESAQRQSQKLESLGVLAGGIAHDFNNLLTAILGNTEVALDRASADEALRGALQRIETATQRGSDLARQLLAYAGKASFTVVPLDLNSIILEMGDLLSVSISKKVALRMDLHTGLPPVDTDGAQFQQIVMNLVINASEAIGDRPGTVTLRTRTATCDQAELTATFPGQAMEPGSYVRMEVEDDGCGMDAEIQGRIFDPFFTTKFTGRGLGLSAMLGIVRGHRAGIRVESTPGQGTTFILQFPVSKSDPIPAVTLPGPPTRVSGTVLVVDDEGIIRDLARNALENAGFRVLEARDGLEGVERFAADPRAIDLVLLDMTMPRMGGAEAFRRIRGLSAEVRVLLTSGYTQKESMESLSDLPPDGFLQKPFRVKELVHKVQNVLRDSRGMSSNK